MKTHATLENPCSCSCHRNGDEDPCKKCDPMKVPIRDWEKEFDEKVKELENASSVSEEIVQFGYRYIMKDDGYTIITATATDWGNIKSFIKAQIRKAVSETLEKVDKEVIGEDDKYPAPGNYEYMKVRNNLRASQRVKLKKLEK